MKKSSIESPCISVCRYDNEVCRGCGRTVDEVVEWYNMTDKQKQAVLNRLEKESKGWFK
jgi:predicted Fe-S protein YdhL (DUF1289 family)